MANIRVQVRIEEELLAAIDAAVDQIPGMDRSKWIDQVARAALPVKVQKKLPAKTPVGRPRSGV